jgi:hypothetical protein
MNIRIQSLIVIIIVMLIAGIMISTSNTAFGSTTSKSLIISIAINNYVYGNCAIKYR